MRTYPKYHTAVKALCPTKHTIHTVLDIQIEFKCKQVTFLAVLVYNKQILFKLTCHITDKPISSMLMCFTQFTAFSGDTSFAKI